MSMNDLVMEMEEAARRALAKAGATKQCPIHSDVTIRVGDDAAERHAYAIATNELKRDGTPWLREELMPVIKSELEAAAEDECPVCADIRDS